MENQILEYKGSKISFLQGENVMVNATDMAKPFDKSANHWLRNSQAQEFLNTYTKLRNRNLTEIVVTKHGGDNRGTWMHEDVALEFARWLSPEFAIWCNDRIKELMNHGFTATNDKLEELANNPDLLIQLATQLKSERAEKERLEFQNQQQKKSLQEAAPKVQYCDEVLQSESEHTTTLIAKELGMGAQTLNKKLRELGIQYRQKETWVLYHRYQNKGYTKTRTHPYYNSQGELKTSIQTVWTEKGRQFIHQKLKS